MNSNESKSYEKMTAEVETIISDISHENIGLDKLLKKVETGYQILKKMQTRLNEVHIKIEDIQKQYENDEQQKS